MNTDVLKARGYIAQAREALRHGDKPLAWQMGKRATVVAPEMEEAWLVLTASDPNPRNALAYARKALKLNPASIRARRALEWAVSRVEQREAGNVLVKQNATSSLPMEQKNLVTTYPRFSPGTTPAPQLKINGQNRLYLAFLVGIGCLMVGFVALFALMTQYPALTSIVNNINRPATKQENLWASVDIAKPTLTPIDVSVFAPRSTDGPANALSDAPALALTAVPTLGPTATETPGTFSMEIVTDDSIGPSVPPPEDQIQYPAEGNGERWIDVNLSEQHVYAYEGDVVVNSFLASTGVAQTPTVTGKYKIYVKVRIQDMSGPGYYLRDVPWVMFFYDEYGFHGTYWHNNFGTPMSRGCVNLTIDDAAWLYNWASVGTVVNIHY